MVLKPDERNSRLRKGLSFGTLLGARYFYSDCSDVPDIINGMLARLNLWEASLNIFPMLPEIDHFAHLRGVIGRNLVDGLFLIWLDLHTAEIADYFRRSGFPVIFIAPCKPPRMPDTPLLPCLMIDEQTTVDRLLAGLKNRFDVLTFIGLEGIETVRTHELFQSSPQASGFALERRELKPGTNLFPEMLSLLGAGGLERRLLVLSSRHILPQMTAAAAQLGLSAPRDFSALYFKHYSSDYESVHNPYDSIERDLIKLGKKAADLMKTLMERKRRGLDFHAIDPVTIKSVHIKRGSIRA